MRSRPFVWGVFVQQSQTNFRNRLLNRLDHADLARLAPHLTRVALPLRMPLVSPGEPIDRCYFLESGVASVVATTADGKQAEVGLIGREGMLDVAAVMGGDRTPLEVFIRMPGDAFAIPTSEVIAVFDDSRAFRRLLLGFAHSFLVQVAQTALFCHRRVGDRRSARALAADERRPFG